MILSELPIPCTISCSKAQSTEAVLCTHTTKSRNYTEGEIESILESIRKKLKIEKKKTKKYQNTLISAPDDRFSAKAIGYTGATILIALVSVVVLMDLTVLINGIRNRVNRFRN